MGHTATNRYLIATRATSSPLPPAASARRTWRASSCIEQTSTGMLRAHKSATSSRMASVPGERSTSARSGRSEEAAERLLPPGGLTARAHAFFGEHQRQFMPDRGVVVHQEDAA